MAVLVGIGQVLGGLAKKMGPFVQESTHRVAMRRAEKERRKEKEREERRNRR